MVSQNELEISSKLFCWLTISNFLYIIVLLILAGVSIGTIFNSDGLFKRANDVAAKWNQSKENELKYLGNVMNELDKYNREEEVDYFVYDYDETNKTATVKGLKDEYRNIENIVILPKTEHNGEKYTVNKIQGAFQGNKIIKSVKIPSSITEIVFLAFGINDDYNSITSVEFDSTFVGVIDVNAFAGTPWISSALGYEMDHIEHTGTLNINGKEYTLSTYFSLNLQPCFLPGTKVLTTKGMINIEDIKVGDYAYSRNENTQEIEANKVVEVHEHDYQKEIYKIYTETASIDSTYNHKFYVKDNGWVQANELKEGDILLNSNNVEVKITKIEIIESNEIKKVYNIQVENNHNYFVGLDSILVHNKYCFAMGSQVPIDLNGNTKSIEEIKIGDSVLTYNQETKKNELLKVTETYIHENATDIVTIVFKDGTQIVTNMYHPIYTKNGWKSLARYNGYEVLENNDEVKTEEGWKEIESININLNNEPLNLYTISVEGADNFYVNGTLAHDNEY